jgi:hypothetical protein
MGKDGNGFTVIHKSVVVQTGEISKCKYSSLTSYIFLNFKVSEFVASLTNMDSWYS